MTVNVLVLNFNGRELLEKYLPSLIEAVGRSRYPSRLTVVDNKSQDGSVDYLKKNFPSVSIYEARENRVLCSYNEAAEFFKEDILVLMNNDTRVEPDFLDPLIAPFERDSDVFFVTPRCLSPKDGSYEGNQTRGMIRYGLFWSSALYPGYEKRVESAGPTFQGGFGAFDRKKFLALGGYDDLYLPGRLEDADICFRAYKRGWRCLYEPASVVYHEGGVSFRKRFGGRRTLVINWRNTFLFMWKNIGDRLILLEFWLWLPFRIGWAIMTFKPEFLAGLAEALWLSGKAARRRGELKTAGWLRAVSDRRIFEIV